MGGGGQQSLEGKWPWQVSPQPDGRRVCGGSLVNKGWILTAAHGLNSSEDVSPYSVLAGELTPFSEPGDPSASSVEKAAIHPDGSRGGYPRADLAPVKLQPAVRLSPRSLAVCLQRRRKASCWVTGWGRISQEGEGLPQPPGRSPQIRPRWVTRFESLPFSRPPFPPPE
ncbi:serine protease 38 [Ornithorhynchus anatinus]|uniref:serine protease 38 n=1 Tax=Ornithorhynchus anatinus TaxID=9258 RepID=UPI0019D412CE|nr:serine protease 38 [Ornithorhynchus anatinus]